ncbi:LytTR family transcriptional regulator DNA-binding domain-containing protein [Anaerostipes sp.]|uniref:LytTR family transcriptional regulator DNA-binding domain-containing protein n=1 Tax=Anaerostipes sp. TaxID=1872530 RepID=UPI0025C26AC6|nr:LytTR family transcriptional regulator DNA-binding domain-containing protein [Anaerostipes sp.]MBS7006911.1 LytTR family transcriptional regulator DNA-binding domain-containing protein [Anaerostipes sp.]
MEIGLRDILKIMEESGDSLYHFECRDDISDLLLSIASDFYKSVGAVCRKEGFYEFMSVRTYLGMFAELSDDDISLELALNRMQLKELLYCKIKRLTASQKHRLSAAREIVLNRKVLFIQEPILGIDTHSAGLIMKWLELCGTEGKKVITTSQSLKHVYQLPGRHFFADARHIEELTENIFISREESGAVLAEKIPAKMDEKLLLFDPEEIDYIESMQGKNYLHVRQASYQCPMTMDELNEKLKGFGFFRSHRSYIVNMQKVCEVVKWTKNSYALGIKADEEKRIPLSKGRVEELRKFYGF